MRTLALLVLLASGCASVPKYMREVDAKQPLQAPADRALVVFVRSSAFGWAVRAHVMDDQENFLGTAIAGGHFSVLRPPGKQKFVVWSEAADVLVADLAPGLVYFVEVNPAMGLMRARFNFRASHRGTDLFPFKAEYIEGTSRYEVDAQRAKAETADDRDERREMLAAGNEKLREYAGRELAEHTLAPDDGHASVGVPGTVAAPLSAPPVAISAQAPAPGSTATTGFKKGTLVRAKLKSGVSWIGEVVTETSQGVLISTGGGTQMISFAEAQSIEPMEARK